MKTTSRDWNDAATTNARPVLRLAANLAARMAAALLALSGTAVIAQDDAPKDTPERARDVTIDPAKALESIRRAISQLGDPDASATPAIQPSELPELDEAITALMDQVYLSDDELRDLRIKHGVWRTSDLAASPLRQAQRALVSGEYANSAFDAAGVNPLDRIESLIRRGQPDRALTELDALPQRDTSLRALRLRGEACVDLGRRDDAEAALATIPTLLAKRDSTDADEVAHGVRGLILLARLRGADGSDSVGYQDQLNWLGDARDRLDRLSWSVRLAEAMLLYEKGEYEQAGPAVMETLAHNPRCAEAWLLLGRIWVDGMEFEKAQEVAARLDLLAAGDAAPAEAPDDAPNATEEPAASQPQDEPADSSEPNQPPASLGGATIRALVRMRQVEGTLALEDLASALKTYPTNRELLGLQAAAVALSFDFAKSDQLLAALDTLSPNYAEGYLLAGKALAGARQYEDAARLLRIASDRAPGWAEPLYQLGLSELQAGRLDESKRALQLGLALDRKHIRAANSLALLNEIATYKTMDGEHFTIRYKDGPDEIMAREMLSTLEKIFARVTGDGPGGIRHVPTHKTVVELYPNHRWFATRITGLPQLHTFAAATGPVIAMEVPRDGPGHLVGPYDWARVVQHEYTHTVTLSRTKNRLPHWFTEAGAVYLEDAPVDYNVVQILHRAFMTDSFFDFDTINVMFARPRKPTDRTQAYMQGAWMYAYIIDRWGMEAPLELMDLYASGLREEAAFEKVLSTSRDAFLSDFKGWFEGKLREWGMVARDGQKTLDQFVEEANVEELTPELLEQWRQQQPDNPFVLERIAKGISDHPGGATKADIPVLEAYAAARPVDPLPHKLLAALYLKGQEDLSPQQAIPHLEYLDAREQNSPSFAAELARQYAAAGDWTKALPKIRRATQISPYDASLRELAARLSLQAGDRDLAESHIWALTLIEPDRAIHKQRLEAVRKK